MRRGTSKFAHTRSVAAVAGLLGGCKPVASPQLPAREVAVAVAVVEPDDGPCGELAQLYCEQLGLACAATRDLLAAADTGPAACAQAVRELSAVRDVATRQVARAAAAESLRRVLDASPLTAGEIEAHLAPPPADETQATQPAADLDCPSGTMPVRAPGADGARAWCKRADGLPSGPVMAWNGRGEVVQDGRFVDGKLIDAGIVIPASREFPPGLFACPYETSERGRVDGPQRAKWCERRGGAWHGPALEWRGGLVTRFAQYEEGTEVRAFAMGAD